MSVPRRLRRLALATLTILAWLTVNATAAAAKVAPDVPESAVPSQSRTVVVTSVDWGQLAVTAAAACLVGVLATLAVEFVVRHSHRPSMTPA